DADGTQGEIRRYPTDPARSVRVSSRAEDLSAVDGLPARHHVWNSPELPDPVPGVLIAVSTLVADRIPVERRGPDILIPDSGPGSVVRDSAGSIVGVRYWTIPFPGKV